MNNIFLLIFCISFLCIPIFIIWAVINLIQKKQAKKRFACAGISALVLIISTIGFGLTMDDAESDQAASMTKETPAPVNESPETQPTATPTPQPTPEPTKASEDTSDVNIVSPGEAETTNEDPLGFSVTFSDTYRNDVTGNWRLSRIAEYIDIEEYAVDYYNNYFKSDSEIHIIINFTLNTTTRITVMGNLLDVAIMEYVDKEEHDAALACSGTLLSEYHVDIDTGEIEKIQ